MHVLLELEQTPVAGADPCCCCKARFDCDQQVMVKDSDDSSSSGQHIM